MSDKLLIHGTISQCCNRPSLIVRSRDGGFVTQNCEKCGKPRKIGLAELPPLICSKCGKHLTPFINVEKNYAYTCPCCGTQWKLCNLVPDWSENFTEWGLGLETDFHD